MPRVSSRVRRNATAILALSRAAKQIQRLTLQTAKQDLVLALVECAKNIISGNVVLNSQQIAALRRHQRALVELCGSRTSLKRKRQILQTGGFLSLLLKPLAGLIGGLFGGKR